MRHPIPQTSRKNKAACRPPPPTFSPQSSQQAFLSVMSTCIITHSPPASRLLALQSPYPFRQLFTTVDLLWSAFCSLTRVKPDFGGFSISHINTHFIRLGFLTVQKLCGPHFSFSSLIVDDIHYIMYKNSLTFCLKHFCGRLLPVVLTSLVRPLPNPSRTREKDKGRYRNCSGTGEKEQVENRKNDTEGLDGERQGRCKLRNRETGDDMGAMGIKRGVWGES